MLKKINESSLPSSISFEPNISIEPATLQKRLKVESGLHSQTSIAASSFRHCCIPSLLDAVESLPKICCASLYSGTTLISSIDPFHFDWPYW